MGNRAARARPVEGRNEYRRFVESELGRGADETSLLLKSSTLAVGGDKFVDWVRSRLIERGLSSKCAEDTGLRNVVDVLPVRRVLEVAAEMLGVQLQIG